MDLNGISPKHKVIQTDYSNTFSTSINSNTDEMFEFMSMRGAVAPSGCIVFYNPKHNSYNAISYKPLDQIPGSGYVQGVVTSNELALLVDIFGTPHWMSESQNAYENKIIEQEYILASRCKKCGFRFVRNEQEYCFICFDSMDFGMGT